MISRVHNLKQSNSAINHEALCEAMIEEFKTVYSTDCEVISPSVHLLLPPSFFLFLFLFLFLHKI